MGCWWDNRPVPPEEKANKLLKLGVELATPCVFALTRLVSIGLECFHGTQLLEKFL